MKIGIGTVIKNRYKITSELGEGGFARVYESQDMDLNRQVAIKVLKLSAFDFELDTERFLQEARLLSKLSHPNIVSVFSTDLLDDGTPFVVMEFLQGESLGSVVAKKGKLDAEFAMNIFSQICDGLSYIHSNNIVHRDISPFNIYLIQEDINVRVKLIDFGLAKCLMPGSSKMTKTGAILGNPAYVSPELINAKAVDQRSDIYSLGCVMYYAFSGRVPVEAEDPFGMLYLHQNSYPQEFSLNLQDENLASRIKAAVLRCLQKNPDLRFQTCQELKQSLCNSSQSSSQLLQITSRKQLGGWSNRAGLTKHQNLTSLLVALCGTAIFFCLLWQAPNLLEESLLRCHSPAFAWAELKLAEYFKRKSPDRTAVLLENILAYNLVKASEERQTVLSSLLDCYTQMNQTDQLLATLDKALECANPSESLLRKEWSCLDSLMNSKASVLSLREEGYKAAVLLHCKLLKQILASELGSIFAGNVAEALADHTCTYGLTLRKSVANLEFGRLSDKCIVLLLAVLKKYPMVHFSSAVDEKIDYEIRAAYLYNSGKDVNSAVDFLSLQLAQHHLNQSLREEKSVLKVKCLAQISPRLALGYGKRVLKSLDIADVRFDLLLTLAENSKHDCSKMNAYLKEAKSMLTNEYGNYERCYLVQRALNYYNRESHCYFVPLNICKDRAFEIVRLLPGPDELGAPYNMQIKGTNKSQSYSNFANNERAIDNESVQLSFCDAALASLKAAENKQAESILKQLFDALQKYNARLGLSAQMRLKELSESKHCDRNNTELANKILRLK